MNKEYSTTIGGKNVSFEFKDSLIHTEGNAAGNIDAIITTQPPLPQNLLLDELHIKIPGTNEYLYIYGFGAIENSLKATFNSSALVDMKNLPEKVEIYWGANGERFIGEMICLPYSEKIEHDLADEIIAPEEINETPRKEKPDNEIKAKAEVVKKLKPKANKKKDETTAVENTISNINIIIAGVIILLIVLAAALLFI